MSSPLIVVPARMSASRLPGKPLADIGGKPMIVRVLERARLSGIADLAVAAGDPEIVEAVQAAGGRAVLTDPDLPSGTDRIHAALSDLDPDGSHDIIVNLQGDMPTFEPVLINRALAVFDVFPEADIATLVSPTSDATERADENVVKAVMAGAGQEPFGRCLCFTRCPAPWGDGPVLRHVGLYAFRRAALDRFVAAPPSPLEVREKLEQMRALEMGMVIGAAVVDVFPKGVDTPAHLEAARAWYREQGVA
jgi:3-deoxy-manno-octulosonate cytidylyltransferase (CMP-KDO synthetase)